MPTISTILEAHAQRLHTHALALAAVAEGRPLGLFGVEADRVRTPPIATLAGIWPSVPPLVEPHVLTGSTLADPAGPDAPTPHDLLSRIQARLDELDQLDQVSPQTPAA